MDNDMKAVVAAGGIGVSILLLGVAVGLGLAYLFWVLLSWGIVTIVVAFGGTVGLSPWALAVPLWLTSIVVSKIFKRGS